MSNESVVPVFGTFDRDTGLLKGVGPLGVPYTVIGGGGTGAFVGITGSPYDNTALGAALNGKLGSPSGYDAVNGVPTITAGVAPASNAPQSYRITSAGITATVSALQADIPALRNGDAIVWSPTMSQWIRYAGEPFGVVVNSALTLTDAHNDCTLICSGTPALTVGTGRMPGFGFSMLGAYTMVTTGLSVTDKRKSAGDATDYTFFQQTTDTSTYRWSGAIL